MANLDQELQKFKTSVMGEEIRDALFNSVTLMNNDLSHIVALGGIPGEKGDPFTYADFTMQQLEALKVKGDKGEPFKYSDFTPEQLSHLKGPKGDEGIQGDEGPQGIQGGPFTYSDFTPEQLELLKGVQGEQGEPFKYSDFTPEQLELLKGEKGDAFTYADFTQAQLNGLVGEKGDAFTYADFTPEQLELLKGPKGDAGDGAGDMLASIYDTNNNGIVDNAEKVNGFTIETAVPSGAKFTDTIVDITGKADKTYVDNKVKTDVPLNAKFTDTNTITSINGKIGVITKDDITSLGIPAQDTIVDISGKVDKVTGKGLSTNDYTTAEKNKLSGIQEGAQVNTVTSVAGRTGAVTVSKSDVGLANVDNIKQMPISGGILENYREKLVALSGTSTTINLSLGNVFTHNLTGNTTYSITNAVNGQAHSFTLIVNMGSTVRTLTFPASVKWQGGEIPDMGTANKTYVLTFVTVNGGTNWLGMFGGEF